MGRAAAGARLRPAAELAFGDSLTLSDLATCLDELKHELLEQGAGRLAAFVK